MNNSDGSIYVNTELDSEGFESGSDRLKAAVKSLESQVSKLGPMLKNAIKGGDFSGYRASAADAKAAISEMERELEALGHKEVPTDRYNQLTQAMDRAAAEAEKLRARQQAMRASGVDESSRQWATLQEKIDYAAAKVDRYNDAIRSLEDGGMAFTPGSATSEYAALASRIEDARSRLADMNREADKAQEKAHGIRSAFAKIGSAVGGVASKIGSGVGRALSGAFSLTRRLIGGNNDYSKSFGGLISSARKFTLSLLGARGVYALLRKAVSAYMAENQALANTLSSCWSGIGNLLGPIITRLINLVASAVAWVTSFLKLFGVVGKGATKAIGAAGGAATGMQT